jgi:hypothetical protein
MHHSSTIALLASTLALLVGCGAGSPSGPTAAGTRTQALRPGTGPPADAACEFARGVTECRAATAPRVEVTTHAEVSGCTAFDGTAFVAGVRTRTFEDQVQVSDITTTLQHGRSGRVFDTRQTTDRQVLSSTLLSDQCVPIASA